MYLNVKNIKFLYEHGYVINITSYAIRQYRIFLPHKKNLE